MLDTSGGGVVFGGLLSQDGTEGLTTNVDGVTGRITLALVAKGRSSVIRRSRVDAKAPFTIGFALCENQVTVLIRDGQENWAPVLTERTRVARILDFRQQKRLGAMDYVWGVRRGSARLGGVRAGLFGMTGLRDPHLVQNADGSPYLREGKAFLTWTCAGLGFFQQAHWGVFSLDLAKPTGLTQVAQIYARRDDMVLGDHAGQLVRDGDQWLLANSSWGDFDGNGVHVRHASTSADLLSGVHVIDTEKTDLPTTQSSWDPSFSRIDRSWWLAYVESPSQQPFLFHPAVARSEAPDPFSALAQVAAAIELRQTEGTILARDGAQWFVLASDGSARRYPIFDLELQRIGSLDAPYGSNIPHPQVIPRDEGWLMVTFDGTDPFTDLLGYGGHGDVVVMTER